MVTPDLAPRPSRCSASPNGYARAWPTGLAVGADRHLPTISVGIVIASSADTAITALRDADTAMYRAKETGRDRAEWFDPSLHRDVVASFEVERDLRRAIEQGQLYLDFQPVLDLETDEIASCEALVRWRHPERGMLGPDEFIPAAENTGLIVSLGRWVLRARARDRGRLAARRCDSP